MLPAFSLLVGVVLAIAGVALIAARRLRGSRPSPKGHEQHGPELLKALSPRPKSCPAQPQPEEAAAPPLLQLRDRLAEAFQAEKERGVQIGSRQPPESAARLDKAVRELIQEYLAAGHQDWKDWVLFNSHHYVRHLISNDENFEIMVICWQYGQGSRVHNHADSHCWLTVLQGCVHEVQYRMPETAPGTSAAAEPPQLPGVLEASAPCPRLQHIGTHELEAGQTGYINDTIALHAVRVPEHCPGAGAVTLHVYAPPIRRVKLFEPDNDRVVQRQPGFFTTGLGERKRRQAAAALSAAEQQSGAAPVLEALSYDI